MLCVLKRANTNSNKEFYFVQNKHSLFFRFDKNDYIKRSNERTFSKCNVRVEQTNDERRRINECYKRKMPALCGFASLILESFFFHVCAGKNSNESVWETEDREALSVSCVSVSRYAEITK